MLTVGVDLAAQPKNTAIAVIDWSPGRAKVTRLEVGADDDAVIDAVGDVEKAGIDCPLGWPIPFIDFVTAHRDGHEEALDDEPDNERRHRLSYRTTDIATAELLGRSPLSVSSDRIGRTVMRAANLLAKLAAQGEAVDRSGVGVVVEVYPAASLRVWGLTRHRNDANWRSDIVDRLTTAPPWLDLGSFEMRCRTSSHAFDAVIAAFTARAAALGLTHAPTDEQMEFARVEGWIAVPTLIDRNRQAPTARY
jgi:predicted nuclease with RNAse H fold